MWRRRSLNQHQKRRHQVSQQIIIAEPAYLKTSDRHSTLLIPSDLPYRAYCAPLIPPLHRVGGYLTNTVAVVAKMNSRYLEHGLVKSGHSLAVIGVPRPRPWDVHVDTRSCDRHVRRHQAHVSQAAGHHHRRHVCL